MIALPIRCCRFLLRINLVTDGCPASRSPPSRLSGHHAPPAPPGENIFARGVWQHVAWVGLLMAGVTLATQAWAYHAGSKHWQTMAFTVLALSQMGHVLAIRSERESLFRIGIGSNPWLLAAVALTVVLQLGTIYLPGASRVFKTQPLSARELLICLALSAVVFLAVEAKMAIRRRGLYRPRGHRPASLRSVQVVAEPVAREPADLFHRAWLLEQVARALDHLQALQAPELIQRHLVQAQDGGVQAADDQKRRRMNLRQPIPSQIRAASTGNDGMNAVSRPGRGDQCRPCARARTEVSQSQLAGLGLLLQPVARGEQAIRE
jgi:hypothetical protein